MGPGKGKTRLPASRKGNEASIHRDNSRGSSQTIDASNNYYSNGRAGTNLIQQRAQTQLANVNMSNSISIDVDQISLNASGQNILNSTAAQSQSNLPPSAGQKNLKKKNQ